MVLVEWRPMGFPERNPHQEPEERGTSREREVPVRSEGRDGAVGWCSFPQAGPEQQALGCC